MTFQIVGHPGTLSMSLLCRFFLACCLATFAVVGAPSTVHAHPHAWIDLRSTVKLDDEGRITALVLDWTFGLYYSAFILEGIVEAGTPLQQTLNETTHENLSNLREFDYFTVVKVDGEKQDLGAAEHFETAIKDNRYWMRFEIPLIEPINPKTRAVAYAVYDPTYYIEIVYAEDGERVGFENPGVSACIAEIIEPNPSTEVIGFATSLDQTQSGGDTLGKHFAETVRLSCQ